MKLRFIHPGAKAGDTVRIPGFNNNEPIAYGQEVEWPTDLWRAAVANGQWERLAADVKAEAKPEGKREVLPVEKESN